MKYLLTTFLFAILCINSFSQIKVKIGTEEENVYPLEINQSEFSTDLLPLKSLFADKEIIGMGEATHGTKEFFDLKSKTFKFLVTNCNYKIFGIEASDGGCSYINDYVVSGIGNIDSVMHRFDFWTWRTEEVKELVLWIKNYNQQKIDSEKIIFYGFDMQNFYTPIQYLNDFFKAETLINYTELKIITNPILNKSNLQIYNTLKNKELKFADTLSSINLLLVDWINKNKQVLETKYSAKQFERLIFCADNYGQAVKNISANDNFRDSCMATNILKIQTIENSKMFVWAHNGHINLSYPDNYYKTQGLPMGAYLRKALDTKYYTIGFVFNQGGFQARQGPKSFLDAIYKSIFSRENFIKGLKEFSIPVNKKNTLTNILSSAKLNAFLINLQATNNSLFSTTQRTYDIGSVFMNYKRCSGQIIAKKQFDGLIYISKATRAMPIK